jgi:hypothetical protein
MQSTVPIGSQHEHTSYYEVCAHTCVPTPCISKSTGSILWKSNGNSVRRHATKHSQHLLCNISCPCYHYLGLNSSPKCVRPPTTAEMRFIDQIMNIDEEDDDDDDMDDETSVASTQQVVNLLSDDNRSYQSRPLRIIYIPDPTLAVSTLSAAKNDLAFIHAKITPHEYDSIRNLIGSVHVNGSKVILQEWVCINIYSAFYCG